MHLNKVEIAGGVVRDVDLRFTPGGTAVAQFTVACSEPRWDSKDRVEKIYTTYVSVEVWGAMAEQATEEISRGDDVYVLGSLTQNEFEKKDGTKERKTRVRAAFYQITRSMRAVRQSRPDRNYGPPQDPAGAWGPPVAEQHPNEPPF